MYKKLWIRRWHLQQLDKDVDDAVTDAYNDGNDDDDDTFYITMSRNHRIWIFTWVGYLPKRLCYSMK